MGRTGHRPLVALLAVATAALTLAACTAASDAPAGAPVPAPAAGDGAVATPPLTVVVTTSILGDLVQRLVASDGTVRVLVGPGVDPHAYAASAADAAALRDADLVVANGLRLEEGLLTTLEAARTDGVDVLEVAPALDPIPFAIEADGHDHDHDHDHDDAEDGSDGAALDPHVWFDPVRMATAVELVADALAALRPDVAWAARAATVRAELEALDGELAAALATVPEGRRRLVTNHDALGYLADRYGFTVIGTVIPGSSTAAETDPAAFAALVDLLVAEGIDVVFAETTDSDALARRLAAEAVDRGGSAVRVVTLFTGSLGPPGSGAETYTGLLRTNVDRIVAALAG